MREKKREEGRGKKKRAGEENEPKREQVGEILMLM